MKNIFADSKMSWVGSGRKKLLDRHFRIITRHLTARKIRNILLNQLEFKLQKDRPKSFPVYMKIEPTRFCHLRCPYCPHSDPKYNKQFTKTKQLKFNDFKKIVDPLSDTLLGISLSNYGEPLWCEDLTKMIEYANNKNVGTMFPTNLSVPLSDDKAEKLVRSGLDMIMVSLNGATQETYDH